MEKLNNIMLSAVIITKNEEKKIGMCIDSLKFADEILVVDSESKDKTVHIAREKGAKVISRTFTNFSDLRNAGLKQAKGDWILYIDADEYVSSELADEIKTVIQTGDKPVYKIPRKNIYFHKYQWPSIEHMERLFRKNGLAGWYGDIHESPRMTAHGIGQLTNPILHYTHNDLESMVSKTNQWGDLEATLIYKTKHPNMKEWRFIRIMCTKFYGSYIKQAGWRAGVPGLIESVFQAYSYFIIYAKLWELQRKRAT